ncbi:hypothetical protein PybrP1_009231 [[Pythium] brassicae (nom. inval.)]|nr:hypothetical protein PybrP1_009231 [[Pythium] brassicae (nom. inval.)]
MSSSSSARSSAPPAQSLVNVNVGVMGHVDSGKTSLVRVLSTQLSTAALDKHPQSQQRGITLDLGFSALRLLPSAGERDGRSAASELQVTLVDCPGHASLFKTILGGARIIDMVLLVVDATKGLQPQTIESLLVAELAVHHHVVVALNKTDLIPASVRETRVRNVQKEIRAFLTRHFASFRGREPVPIVPVSAAPQGADDGQSDSREALNPTTPPRGIAELVATLRRHLHVPDRDRGGPFSFAIDHCFAIQGNGTILTGTVLSGAVHVGDALELPSLQVVKTVKSMQMFRQPVAVAAQGDRVGIRVNGLDASLVERGMAVTPRSMAFVAQVVVPVHRVALFQGGSCKTGGKFHSTVGHTTVVAVATFFARIGDATTTGGSTADNAAAFDPAGLYEYVEQVAPPLATDADNDERVAESSERVAQYFALLQFDQPVLCPPDALVVCSRLDLDPKKFACRLAFHGRVQAIVTASADKGASLATSSDSTAPTLSPRVATLPLSHLRIGKVKSRNGVVDKLVSTGAGRSDAGPREVICRDMFSKAVDWHVYANTTVLFEASRVLGRVAGPFGKAGKFRVTLLDPPPTLESSGVNMRRPVPSPGERVVLRFVKLVALKPPSSVKSKNKSGAPGGSAAVRALQAKASGSSRSKAAGNLLQDDRQLYPEALTPRAYKEETLPATAVVPDVSTEGSAAERGSEATLLAPHPQGRIERLKGETTPDGRNPIAIVSGLFASDEEATSAIGRLLVVVHSTGEDRGAIEKPFGKAGKVRVVFAANSGTRAREGDVVMLLHA